MNLLRTNSLVLLVSLGLFLGSCKTGSTSEDSTENLGLEMAKKMADSEIKLFPAAYMVDFIDSPKWNYTSGLISLAMMNLWKETGDEKYFNYAKGYADSLILEDGSIYKYNMENYNIDKLNSGKFLFGLYEKTGDERYMKAIEQLRDQLNGHPRTSEGGFWHKERYPWQMWLDGLYMGSPFYAQWAAYHDDSAAFADVVNQFKLVHKYTYDSTTSLNYHGWDESKKQKWANPETGKSPNFWGRAMGWYIMAIVDVLDFLPADHPERDDMIAILNDVALGIKNYQDSASGVWYQVLDKGNREGNYLEATASSMYVYGLLKAVRLNYIDSSYKEVAIKGYKGLLDNFIKENEDGTISLTKCCAVAGLGGNPYRDGSFEYYISEPVRDNDPKGVGPFIMASIEYSYLQ